MGILVLMCCKEPYTPPATSTPNSYLVVDGVINPGGDSTIIKLSKTVPLTSNTTVNPVRNAAVTVESDQNGAVWPLNADGHGNYIAVGLNLPVSARYRLSIITNDASYLSDFVPFKPTPPIDSVGYKVQNGALQVYVNTHDPANNTTFYRWDYQETWIFHSEYTSYYRADLSTQTIVPRTPDQFIYYCYAGGASSAILLGSSQHLSKDVIYQSQLTNIPLSAEKVEQKYSILVRQYALTGEAFAFFENLKKNTEQLGTIFDNLPSQFNGNIHNVTNPAIPAIGYVTVTNMKSKRIFISGDDLPFVRRVYPYECETDTVSFAHAPLIFLSEPAIDIPITTTKGGYLYSSSVCVDCTLRGTTKTPSFWK